MSKRHSVVSALLDDEDLRPKDIMWIVSELIHQVCNTNKAQTLFHVLQATDPTEVDGENCPGAIIFAHGDQRVTILAAVYAKFLSEMNSQTVIQLTKNTLEWFEKRKNDGNFVQLLGLLTAEHLIRRRHTGADMHEFDDEGKEQFMIRDTGKPPRSIKSAIDEFLKEFISEFSFETNNLQQPGDGGQPDSKRNGGAGGSGDVRADPRARAVAPEDLVGGTPDHARNDSVSGSTTGVPDSLAGEASDHSSRGGKDGSGRKGPKASWPEDSPSA